MPATLAMTSRENSMRLVILFGDSVCTVKLLATAASAAAPSAFIDGLCPEVKTTNSVCPAGTLSNLTPRASNTSRANNRDRIGRCISPPSFCVVVVAARS